MKIHKGGREQSIAAMPPIEHSAGGIQWPEYAVEVVHIVAVMTLAGHLAALSKSFLPAEPHNKTLRTLIQYYGGKCINNVTCNGCWRSLCRLLKHMWAFYSLQIRSHSGASALLTRLIVCKGEYKCCKNRQRDYFCSGRLHYLYAVLKMQ